MLLQIHTKSVQMSVACWSQGYLCRAISEKPLWALRCLVLRKTKFVRKDI